MIRRADLDLEVSVELGFKVLGFSWFLFLVFMLKSYGLEGPFVFLFSFFLDSPGFGVTFKLSFPNL